jgi:hypothetical protein
MFEKILLVILAVFFPGKVQLQVTSALIISFIFFVLQVKFEPMNSDILNMIESIALLSSCFLFSFGLFFFIPDCSNDSTCKQGISLLIAVSILIFMAICLWAFVNQIQLKFTEDISKERRKSALIRKSVQGNNLQNGDLMQENTDDGDVGSQIFRKNSQSIPSKEHSSPTNKSSQNEHFSVTGVELDTHRLESTLSNIELRADKNSKKKQDTFIAVSTSAVATANALDPSSKSLGQSIRASTSINNNLNINVAVHRQASVALKSQMAPVAISKSPVSSNRSLSSRSPGSSYRSLLSNNSISSGNKVKLPASGSVSLSSENISAPKYHVYATCDKDDDVHPPPPLH